MSKNQSLRKSKARLLLWLWLCCHAAALAPFGISFLLGKKVSLDSDLLNMIPASSEKNALQIADKKLSETANSSLKVFVAHENFQAAKEAAEFVYGQIIGSDRFKSVSLYADSSAMEEITGFIHEHRWNLLSEDDVASINSDGGKEFAFDALSKIYGAFSLSATENLESDPFALGDQALQNYLAKATQAGTSFSERDGVLATEHDGSWYVLLSFVLSAKGARLASKTSGVAEIYEVCGKTESQNTGVRFVYFGSPFHSHESSAAASKEITVISAFSLAAVLALLMAVFRSPAPILYSTISLAVSIATAFCSAHAIFGKIHLLALVFGTSLIGSCIDYSLHYFINWKANKKLHSGQEVRRSLLTGLTLSLVSTEICYLTLFFAPFNLLKQIAVFSMTGILSSFLTVTCVYPLLKMPAEKDRNMPLLKIYRQAFGGHKIFPASTKERRKRLSLAITLFLLAAAGSTLFVCRKNLRVENNLAKLYTMKGRLAEDTILAAKILNQQSGGWFIVSGKSAEDVLQAERGLSRSLENSGVNFLATSLFIPPVNLQERSREACQKLLARAQEQYEALGYGESASLAKKLAEDFESSRGKFVAPESGKLPKLLGSALEAVWLGRLAGEYYSVVLPSVQKDRAEYEKIAAENPSIYFVSKAQDIGRELDRLTKTILFLFAVSLAVIFAVLKFFYTWSETFRISSVPLLIMLVIASVFAANNIPLEFFSITGIILVFGLGLDYVIYMVENERKNQNESAACAEAQIEPFAVFVSFLTTAVSFGALALSGFVPVHLIGLSVFLGLATAFVCTLF